MLDAPSPSNTSNLKTDIETAENTRAVGTEPVVSGREIDGGK